MVLLVEHLSCKHEDLNLISRICQKKKKKKGQVQRFILIRFL